ncbi:MAG TPA: thiamine-phosphate kinase [Thermoanaerobaculia bacterium]
MKGEDRFVDVLRALVPPAAGVRLGPGDDAAIVDQPAGLLAATTDLLVEGVDFLPGEDPERLGRRAAAVNLSDLAAMGVEPEFFLLSIGFDGREGAEYPLAIARGAIARAGAFGARLVGGDLSDAPQTVISVALWGRPAGAPLTRSGAAPGDVVFLSGHPGEAAAGLRLARRVAAFSAQGSRPTPHFPELDLAAERRLLAAFRDPVPRVALGIALARQDLASAAIDVSDGVGKDAGRLARSSGVRLVLERQALPFSPALLAFAGVEEIDPLELLLSGGDDYELLFTASPAQAERFERGASGFDVPVARIGRIEAGRGAVLSDGASERDIAPLGHDHLERAS